MDVEVREVDPDDETALHTWWDVGRIANAHDHVDVGWPSWDVARRSWRHHDPARRMLRLAAYAGDDVVGVCSVQLEDLDNTHFAGLQPRVLPDRRRAGVGTALLEAAEARARAEGRTTFLSEVFTPVGAHADPSLEFARHRGYAEASSDEIKLVDLTSTEHTWPALAAQAAERAVGYELVSWTAHAPEQHVAELARLFTRFLAEVPLGDVRLEPQTWTTERIRQSEERWAASGKHQVLVAAVAPDGTLAGYTNLFVSDGQPERAGIDSTLVLPEHRGHRLGLALKVRLHQETRRLHPGVQRIATGNADVNHWMNAVNAALGYHVVEACVEMQKVVP